MNRQRAELSKKNAYYIPKEKYYELLYFSRQYNTMRQELHDLRMDYPATTRETVVKTSDISDPVARACLRIETLTDKIRLIEATAIETDAELAKWVRIGVTNDYSYEYMRQMLGMPLGRTKYYELYRKYFYLLAQKR